MKIYEEDFQLTADRLYGDGVKFIMIEVMPEEIKSNKTVVLNGLDLIDEMNTYHYWYMRWTLDNEIALPRRFDTHT